MEFYIWWFLLRDFRFILEIQRLFFSFDSFALGLNLRCKSLWRIPFSQSGSTDFLNFRILITSCTADLNLIIGNRRVVIAFDKYDLVSSLLGGLDSWHQRIIPEGLALHGQVAINSLKNAKAYNAAWGENIAACYFLISLCEDLYIINFRE